MGYKNAGHAQLADHFLQPAAEFLPHLGIDRRKGFVQQQQLGIRCQSTGECHTLPLTAGKLAGIPPLQSPKSDQVYQFHHTAGNGFPVYFLNLQAKGDVVIHSHVPEQRVVLEHKSNATLARRNVIDHFSVNADLTAVGVFQTGDHAENGGFAAAAGSQQTNQLSLFNTEADIIRSLIIAISFLNMI